MKLFKILFLDSFSLLWVTSIPLESLTGKTPRFEMSITSYPQPVYTMTVDDMVVM